MEALLFHNSSSPHSEMVQKWFDTSKFTINSIGTFGNAGRNFLAF